MKDNIKYPERIYANFKSTAGGDVYGGYTNRPLLASDPFDNELYVRADIVKDEIDTLSVEKESLKRLLVNMKNARPQWHDASKKLPEDCDDVIAIVDGRVFRAMFRRHKGECSFNQLIDEDDRLIEDG